MGLRATHACDQRSLFCPQKGALNWPTLATEVKRVSFWVQKIHMEFFLVIKGRYKFTGATFPSRQFCSDNRHWLWPSSQRRSRLNIVSLV